MADPLPAPAPLTTPRWLDLRRLVIASVVVAGAVAAVPALARVDAHLARQNPAVLALCTGALTWLLGRVAARATTPGRAVAWSVLGGAVAGSVNAGAVLSLSSLLTPGGDLGQALGFFVVGVLFGSMIGGPLGAAFGAAYALPLGHAVRARQRPTGDSLESVLASLGAFLALVGAFAGWRHGMPYRAVGFGLVAAGALAIASAVARDVARLAWLARVRAGRNPDYRVRAREASDEAAPLEPVLRVRGEAAADEVIERRKGLGEGPFRRVEGYEPVALAHSAASGARPFAYGRIALALAALAVALAGAASNAMSPWDDGATAAQSSADLLRF